MPNTEALSATPEGVTFNDLGLSPNLLSAVHDAGYTIPTPIQWRAIPEVLKGRDILGIAQTGTGKTASFVLPLIEILSQGRAKARMPRTIILEPTRELAAQVAENFEKYGKNHKLNMALLIGGVSFGDQDAALMRGVDVLIATPGRLLDQFERGKILMSGVQLLVIDEADRMLDMGFIPDIEKIVKLTPFTRQTLFFSATMPSEIETLSQQFLHNPTRIEVARPNQTATTIEQFLVKCPYNDASNKRAILRNIISYEMPEIKNGIIFCNRKRDVDIVAKSLCKHGFEAAPIHGDLQQAQRTATLDRFRAGDLKILVASDVAARGLDVPDVSHVFNFDVPSHSEDYVHRIGRTGRAGRAGKTFMIATPIDEKHLVAVEELIKNSIPILTLDVGQSSEPSNDRPVRPHRKSESEKQKPVRTKNPKGKSIADTPPKADDDITISNEERFPKQKNPDRNKQHRSSTPNKNTPNGEPKDNNNVVGFGSDAPAFMFIKAILPTDPVQTESELSETAPAIKARKPQSRKPRVKVAKDAS